MNFLQQLNSAIEKNNSLACIGLDPDLDKIPKHLLSDSDPIFAFNKAIIDSTLDLVCCYKANIAFYSSQDTAGLESLKKTISYIHRHSNIPFILDAKRADIGNSANYYAKEVFNIFQTDAVTVNPYLGFDAVEPFLKQTDKGVIVLCRTSNPGASDVQSLKVGEEELYLTIAKKVNEWNKQYGNCLLVVGATWTEELKKVREVTPDMFFLVPGIGHQGGILEETLKYGLTKDKSGLVIHSARSIIYASNKEDFGQIARVGTEKLRSEINQYR